MWKISLSFVLVSVVGIGLAALIVQQSTKQNFQKVAYVHAESDFVSQMAGYYQLNGSWDGVNGYEQSLEHSSGSGSYYPFILTDQNCLTIIPETENKTVAQLAPQKCAAAAKVTVRGKTVGYVLTNGSLPPLSSADQQFLTAAENGLLAGALAAFAIALILGIFLARSLTKPVSELTAAIHAMAKGDLQQQVQVRSKDEIGQLSAAFNIMSQDLAEANQQRKQMTADIAHDLRTPVTVIGGYLEALRDGVLASTSERFAVLYEESLHLQRLIEDLRTLSLADANELSLHPQRIAPKNLLSKIAEAYRLKAEQAHIHLNIDAQENLAALFVDVERMTQLIGNLISNALRYTSAGGEIKLSARRILGATVLQVSDTGSGIDPKALPHIFNRFYRADPARAAAGGESGLGLAIVKAIALAHKGTVSAESQLGKGTAFSVTIPDAQPAETT